MKDSHDQSMYIKHSDPSSCLLSFLFPFPSFLCSLPSSFLSSLPLSFETGSTYFVPKHSGYGDIHDVVFPHGTRLSRPLDSKTLRTPLWLLVLISASSPQPQLGILLDREVKNLCMIRQISKIKSYINDMEILQRKQLLRTKVERPRRHRI